MVTVVGESAREAKDRTIIYMEPLSAKARQQPPLRKRDASPSKDHELLSILSYSQIRPTPMKERPLGKARHTTILRTQITLTLLCAFH